MKWTVIALLGLQVPLGLAQEKVDFIKDIKPIFEQTCIKCHSAERAKGKLRMDTKELLFKKTGDEAVVFPGDASKSELYRRITLPADDVDIMPNEGDPLSKAQTDLIRDWINQGANWPDGLVIGPKVAAGKEAAKAKDLGPGEKPAEAEVKAIAELEALGVHARPIAMNVNWREANFYLLGTNVTDSTLGPLRNIPSLVQVHLGGTAISDTGLANIAGLTNLTRLHLEKTPVTDNGLKHLSKLHNLTYLNLYGTTVSDDGLGHLKGLTNLQSLYLWQTKVTDNGVKALKESLPKVEVSMGWDLAAVVKPEEKKEEEKKKD